MKEWFKTHWKACALVLLGFFILSACLGVFNGKEMAQLAKETDKAIVSLEENIKSQDKAVERIYASTKKKVAEQNAEIRKNVKNLDDDAVAAELTALLNEYRRERDRTSSGD